MTGKRVQKFPLYDASTQESQSVPTERSEAGFSYRLASANNHPIPFERSSSPADEFNSPPQHYYRYQPALSVSSDPNESVLIRKRVTFGSEKALSAYSHISDYSDSSSTLLIDVPMPPSDVEKASYYKYLPSGLTDLQKTQQLLIWLAKREDVLGFAPEAHVNPEAKKARLIANTLKQIVIKDLEKGHIHLSWYLRPDKMEELEEKENPINAVNAEKLQALCQANQDLYNEIDDWKIMRGCIYQAHAEATDAIPMDTTICLQDVDVDVEFMLQNINERQLQFYKDYCGTEDMLKLENYDMISPGVTLVRQNLNTMNRFALKVQQFVARRLFKLAKEVHEKTSIIPTERHQHYPAARLSVTDQDKHESQMRNVETMLCLVLRHPHSKPQDTSNDI